MQSGRGSWLSGLPFGVTGSTMIVLVLTVVAYRGLFWGGGSTGGPIRTAKVRQVNWLTSAVSAAGRVASRNNTEIRCKLERVSNSAGGAGGSDGASTILFLVPDGTTVKKGDLICELDSSAYTELVRRQAIGVEKAQAEFLQAELSLSVAEINLQTFLEGTLRQSEQQFNGEIAMAKANLGRQSDRLEWAKRMLDKGYVALSQYSSEEQQLRVQERSLELTEISFQNFKRFSVPKELRLLQSLIEGARANLSFQGTRLKLEQDRLAAYEEQVRRCTIRAPHDGFLIYANEQGKPPAVYEGAPVRQRQRLFELPDLSRMEVQALIHETVVELVRPEMRSTIGIEALPGRVAEGHVVSVSQFPLLDRSNNSSNEVKYYMGVIELERIPSGLRPGMSAEVEITIDRRSSVLVVPPNAVVVESGREVCYVLRPDGVERRTVKVGQRTPSLYEIVEGLDSGEIVSLEPVRSVPVLPASKSSQLATASSTASTDKRSPTFR